MRWCDVGIYQLRLYFLDRLLGYSLGRVVRILVGALGLDDGLLVGGGSTGGGGGDGRSGGHGE